VCFISYPLWFQTQIHHHYDRIAKGDINTALVAPVIMPMGLLHGPILSFLASLMGPFYIYNEISFLAGVNVVVWIKMHAVL
jgi:hypothetical protein